MATDIRSEYERFKALASTPEGSKEINDAAMKASNYEKNSDGEWMKRRPSDGPLVAGFAFDPVTFEYLLDRSCRDHYKARLDLIERMQKAIGGYEERYDWCIDIERRIVEGRAAYV